MINFNIVYIKLGNKKDYKNKNILFNSFRIF